jgi:hypothetical protein
VVFCAAASLLGWVKFTDRKEGRMVLFRHVSRGITLLLLDINTDSTNGDARVSSVLFAVITLLIIDVTLPQENERMLPMG